MIREIVLDTETTGFEPREGHRIVEIGCLELINHVPTGKTFHVYINPKRDVPEEAAAVHGLRNDFLDSQPVFADVAQDFLDFIQESALVIHNAKFDMKFLNAELLNDGRQSLDNDRAIDTLLIARKKFPGAQASLDALCRRFEIDNSNRTLHGALLDSELLAEVYLNLVGGRQPEFLGGSSQKNQQTGPTINAAPTAGETVRLSREFKASSEEIEAHRKFLEELKDPIWLRDR